MGGFLKYAVQMASGGMTYIQDLMKTGTGVQAILRFCLRNLKGSYLQNFMKIGTGVQAILRLCLSNVNGYNVGTTNGRD
jgi:hypothetical protein